MTDKGERPKGRLVKRRRRSVLWHTFFGGLAQLARAPALHAGGQRFESVILHQGKEDNDKAGSESRLQLVISN